MTLTSLQFLLFAILALGIYFLVPKKIKWIVLLVSSLIFLFYDNFSIFTVLEALIVLVTTYLCGILIDKSLIKGHSKKYLILGIVIILGLLIYLKYTNLFLVTFNHLFSLFKINYKFQLVKRTSLIGISYYSLIMISYLIDVYRGACKAEKNIFKCALFMSYFPILTSGPFIRYNNIKDDLYQGHKFDYDRMCQGLIRVLWGLFKVLVISARIGFFIDVYLGDLTKYRGLFLVLSVLLFPIQLYTNFSGSIDIIMGVSEIIGIKLPENFNLPFFSKTMTEFWRRWHITLGAWLKDYIFYPLLKSDFMQNLNTKSKKLFGKKVGKKIPLYLSMFIMWLLIGIWHGGAYTYIIGSGLLQFVFIFLEDILEPVSAKITNKLGIRRDVFGYKLYQIVRTYLLFSFSMLFFRATSVSNAINIIKGMFIFNPKEFLNMNLLVQTRADLLEYVILFASIGLMFIIELLKRKFDVRKKLFEQNILLRWVLIFGLIYFVIIFGQYGPGYDASEFIYRNF